VESPRDSIHSITRATFAKQMAYLAENGYRVISLSQLGAHLSGSAGPLPANAVVVTVDDGWRSTLTEVAPVMRRYGFPFTAFIYPRFIGNGGSSLSWNDVRTLMRGGADIQSHTYSHAFLTRRRQRSRSSAQYAEWLRHELRGSRAVIEKEIGRPVKFLAYPYGDYDTNVARAAAAAGYSAALTCNEGPIVAGADAYRLRRFAIDRTTTFEQFRNYVGRSGAGVKAVSRTPLQLRASAPRPQPSRVVRPVKALRAKPNVPAHVQVVRAVSRGTASDVPLRNVAAASVAAIIPRRELEIVEDDSDDSK
jgi:peptidoglycan/xylan/chitin deacetylase (PgdA/CDA1 family)